MAIRTSRSLKHEYTLFIEQEIENYKESIPRSAILAIGDEAATKLTASDQLTLTEMLLVNEVDRIISKRLRLPAFNTWRKKRLKLAAEMRRPEHWGLKSDDGVVVISSESRGHGQVLVAGEQTSRSVLFLAANGCDVTALQPEEEEVERVMLAALQAGISDKVHPVSAGLRDWTPDEPLHAVVCSHATLDSLTPHERARVIAVLKSATLDGGVHLVETILAGSTVDELKATYGVGWEVSIETREKGQFLLARKDPPVSH